MSPLFPSLASAAHPVDVTRTILLLQVVSAVINASVSKMFPLVSGALLGASFALAILCAAVNVISLILAAKAVDQGIFIPCTTCSSARHSREHAPSLLSFPYTLCLALPLGHGHGHWHEH